MPRFGPEWPRDKQLSKFLPGGYLLAVATALLLDLGAWLNS